MDIDLSKVIGYSRDSLQSRALMRSIMLDLYPGKTREMNVLLDVYESGVPRKIKNDGIITDAKYAQYIQKIVDDYGMQEQWAVVGLNAWIDVCLGKGTAATVKYRVATAPLNGGNTSNANVIGGGYTNPIVHNNSNRNAPVIVKGSSDDYNIKDLGNGKAEISSFNGFDIEDMLVPTEINGLSIIGIGENAFKSCLGLKRLIIPEGIEYILDGAFSGCSNLVEVTFPTTLIKLGNATARWGMGAFQGTKIKKVNLPNGLRQIGHCAFQYCRELTQVELPDDLRVIGYGAFEDCSQLLAITLSEGLQSIEDEAFKGCKGLKELTIPSTVVSFGKDALATSGYGSSIKVKCYPGSKAIEYCRNNRIVIVPIGSGASSSNGFSSANVKPIVHKPKIKDSTNLVQGNSDDYSIKDLGNGKAEISSFNGFDVEDMLIPTEIKGLNIVGIGESAFKSCLGLKRLIIPEGIEYILDGAFSGCSNLMEVTFPTTLIKLGNTTTRWGMGVFLGTKIKKVNLPNGLKQIGHCAFQSCRELCQVELPDELRVIGHGAFKDCSQLLSITLSEGVQRIEDEAFKGCRGLREITIPSTVTFLGEDALATNGYGSSIKVRCYPGSMAIEYCRNNRIVFENAKS